MSEEQSIEAPIASRRTLVRLASAAGLVITACAGAHGRSNPPGPPSDAEGEKTAEVTPGEDLMQEHGVLERILLVYDDASRRVAEGESFDVAVIQDAAGIVRRFVEEYHEKLEEDFVFPRLEQAGMELELIAVLREQHRRGREVTDQILSLVTKGSATPELARLLQGFGRMYRPHAAREDTVLFPALRKTMTQSEYHAMGEDFERIEHERLGEHGFEEMVARVAAIETSLGIHDLSQFTSNV